MEIPTHPNEREAELSLNEYQDMAASTAIYRDKVPREAHLAYVALGLTGEAGECAEKVKKLLRDSAGHPSPEWINSMTLELGDVLWYAALLAHELGIDLEVVARANLVKLSSRKARGTLQGSGDDR